MRDDDFGGHQVGIFGVVDDLRCGLKAQLEGVDVHRCELRRGQLGEQRVIERQNGDIFRDRQADLAAGALNGQSQNIIADYDGSGTVLPLQQSAQLFRALTALVVDLNAKSRIQRQLVLEQRELITGFSVSGEYQPIIRPHIRNAPMPQVVEIIGGFPACQQIVVVDADSLIGELVGLADDDVEDTVFEEEIHDGIILFGVEHDKAFDVVVGGQILHGLQNLLVIPASDNGTGVLAGITELTDAANTLQVERVFKSLAERCRKNNTDHLQGFACSGGRGRGDLISQLCHGLSYPVPGFFADGRVVVAYAGDGGGGYARQCGNIFDGYSHGCAFFRENCANDTGIICD